MLQDKPVLIFESGDARRTDRDAYAGLRCPASIRARIRTGQLDDELGANLGTMGILLEKRNMYIDDSGLMEAGSVRARGVFSANMAG